MSTLLYLAGCPGSGKSTLMAALTARCERMPVTRQPAHDVLVGVDGKIVGVELGARRPAFSGTDALPMNAHPWAVEWVSSQPYPLVLAEGMRLATIKFLGAAHAAGYDVCLGYLECPEAVAAERRAARGSKQNEAWVRGARTRAANFAQAAEAQGHAVVRLAAERSVEGLVCDLASAVPALERLVK